jgi:predicted transcriptional regulator
MDRLRHLICQELHKLIPPPSVRDHGRATGLIQRSRDIDPTPFLWTFLFGTTEPNGSASAVHDHYKTFTGTDVAYSSIQQWITPDLADLLIDLLDFVRTGMENGIYAGTHQRPTDLETPKREIADVIHDEGGGPMTKGEIARAERVPVKDRTVKRHLDEMVEAGTLYREEAGGYHLYSITPREPSPRELSEYIQSVNEGTADDLADELADYFGETRVNTESPDPDVLTSLFSNLSVDELRLLKTHVDTRINDPDSLREYFLNGNVNLF